MNSETTPSVQTPAGIAVQGLAGFVMTLAIVAAPRTRTDRLGLGFYFRPILPTLCGFLQEMQTFPRRDEKRCAQVAISVEVSQEKIKAAARVADFLGVVNRIVRNASPQRQSLLPLSPKKPPGRGR